MATMLCEMIQEIYPAGTAEALQELARHKPMLGLGWKVEITRNNFTEFTTRPIVDVLFQTSAGQPSKAFYSDLGEHRPAVAHAIAAAQCDGLMWDDIAEAMGLAYEGQNNSTEMRIWCLHDMMLILPSRMERSNDQKVRNIDDGWSSSNPTSTLIEFDPLVVIEGPVASNHHGLEMIERLQRARDMIYGVGGLFREQSPMPDLPTIEALREQGANGE